MKKGQKKYKKPSHAKPPHNLVSVGSSYLAWRFTPGGLPGLSHLLPVLCNFKDLKKS
jgi:hypothetical protein